MKHCLFSSVHFGSHGYTANMLKDFSGKCEAVKCQNKFSQTKQCVGWGFFNGALVEKVLECQKPFIVRNNGI